MFHWRDKPGLEVDFVIPRLGRSPVAIECKWAADQFDPAGAAAFRRRYPGGQTFVVAHDVTRRVKRRYGDLEVHVTDLRTLISKLGR